jgi:Flp pilus assembly protein CpaB
VPIAPVRAENANVHARPAGISKRDMALGRTKFNSRRRGRSNQDPVLLIGGGAFALAFLGVIGLYLHLSSAPSDAKTTQEAPVAAIPGVDIIVPVDTLQVGTSFQPTMFRKDRLAEELVSGDVIRSFDELKGMYAKGVLVKGQPIVKGTLTNRQPIHVLTAALPKNYRAVALLVEQPLLDNVDGWAQPGTDVDLVWLTNAIGKETATVLAGPVRVLASNRATEGNTQRQTSSDKLVTVTLLLSVRDSMRVALAASHGKITLGLRGQGDRRPNESSKPISSLITEVAKPEAARPFVAVKVVDKNAKTSEVRKYSHEGRRLDEQNNR